MESNRVLSAAMVVLLCLAGSVSADLVAHWELDEAEGNVGIDSAGDNHGEFHGDPTWQPSGGRIAGALEFDGTDYVDCGNADVLNFGTGDWSVCAWIRTTQSGTGDLNKGTIFANGGEFTGGIRYALAVGENYEGIVTLTTDDDTTEVQAIG
ncbi:MAG: hypothetical protein JSU70_12075, partial [Phycisphaerales bacterium]